MAVIHGKISWAVNVMAPQTAQLFSLYLMLFDMLNF